MTFCTAVTILATILNVWDSDSIGYHGNCRQELHHGWSRNCLSFRCTCFHPLMFFLGGRGRGVRVAQSSVFFVVLGRSLFVFLSFFIFWYVVCPSTNVLENVNSCLFTVGNIQMKFHKLWWNCIWETGWSKSGTKKE